MNKVIVIVLGLVAAAFAVAASAQDQQTPNPVVVWVNGDPVYAADISVAMGSIGPQLKSAGQDLTQEELMQVSVGRIIDQKILAQQARQLELSVDEDRIQAQVDRMAGEAGGRETLEQDLAQGGMSIERMTETLRELELARLFVDSQIRSGMQVTDAELEAFYTENRDSFKRPETVRARHILAKVEEGADEATRKEARERIETARQRALAGEDFAALAEQISDCPSSKRGGDLGFFAYPQMVEPFSEAAFAMEPGGISDVVETKFGYHVIKVEGRRPAEDIDLAEVSSRVRSVVLERKVGEALNQRLSELREQADIEYAEDPQGGPQGQ